MGFSLLGKLNEIWSGADFWDQEENRQQRQQFAAKRKQQAAPGRTVSQPRNVAAPASTQPKGTTSSQAYKRSRDELANIYKKQGDTRTYLNNLALNDTKKRLLDISAKKQAGLLNSNTAAEAAYAITNLDTKKGQKEDLDVGYDFKNGLAIDKRKTGNVETVLNNAGSAIMNVAPQRLAGSVAEQVGLYTNNKGLRDWGERQNKSFRDFNNYSQEVAANKTLATGSQVAGNLLTLPIAPQGKAGMATRFLQTGAPRAADTAFAIRNGGGSETAQKVGSGVVGVTTGLLNTIGGEKILSPGGKAFGSITTKLAPGLSKYAGSALARVASAGNVEGLEEVGEQAVDNLVAQKTYDPNRSITDGLLPSYGLGFAMGGTVKGVVDIAGRGASPDPVSPIERTAHNDLIKGDPGYRALTDSARIKAERINNFNRNGQTPPSYLISGYKNDLDNMAQMRKSMARGGYIAGGSAKDFKQAQEQGRVFEGVDGKPRFEVDDSGAKLKVGKDSYGEVDTLKTVRVKQNGKTVNSYEPRTVGEILDHPTLFKNYPELKDVKVVGYSGGMTGTNVAGEYNPRTNEIRMNTSLPPERFKATLLHEIQHGIQTREGFAGGADGTKDTAYKNLAGEAEARAVASRMNMSDGERYKMPEQLYHGTKRDFTQFGLDENTRVARKEIETLNIERDNLVNSGKIENGALTIPPKAQKRIAEIDKQIADIYNRPGLLPDSVKEKGVYLTNDKNYAKTFAGKDGKILNTTAELDNPYIIKTKDEMDLIEDAAYYPEIIKRLEEQGYDGIKAPDGQVLVFDPTKVKMGKAKPQSTFYDSLDVPKEDLIVRDGSGKAMSVDPGTDINKLASNILKEENIVRSVMNSGVFVMDIGNGQKVAFGDRATLGMMQGELDGVTEYIPTTIGRGKSGTASTGQPRLILDSQQDLIRLKRALGETETPKTTVSQRLREKWGEPNSGKAMSVDPLESLKAEARKYKSAEEFVGASFSDSSEYTAAIERSDNAKSKAAQLIKDYSVTNRGNFTAEQTARVSKLLDESQAALDEARTLADNQRKQLTDFYNQATQPPKSTPETETPQSNQSQPGLGSSSSPDIVQLSSVDVNDPFGNNSVGKRLKNEFGRYFVDEDAEMINMLRKIEKETGQEGLVENWMYDSNLVRNANTIANSKVRRNENLKLALKGLSKGDQSRFDNYAAARTELSNLERGLESSSKPKAELEKIVREGNAEFGNRFKALNNYYSDWANDLYEAGIIDKAKLDEWSKNKDYVRVQRDMEDLLNYTPPSGKSRSFGSTSTSKKRTGSKRDILSPSNIAFERGQQLQLEIQRNKAATRTIDTLVKNGLAEQVSQQNAKGKNVIKRFKDGKVEYFATNKDIKRVVENVNPFQLGVLARVISTPTRLFRAGTTALSAPFAVTNYARDQASSAIYSDNIRATHNPKSVVTGIASATADYFGESAHPLWAKFEQVAGDQTQFDELRNAQSSRAINRELRRGKVGDYVNKVVNPVRSMEDLIGITEKATRFQNFRGKYEAEMKKHGNEQLATQRATQAALQNSVNFSRAGKAMRVINLLIPYSNAGIQGSRNVARSFRDRPVATTMKSVSLVAIPTVLLTLMNYEDEETRKIYENIDETEKDDNFIVVLPGAKQNEKGSYEGVIKIPKPQGYRELMNPFRVVAEKFAGNEDAGDIASMTRDAISAFTGSVSIEDSGKFISSFIPQAVKPGLQARENKDYYWNSQTVPDYMLEGTDDPTKRAYKGTSGTARIVANQLGVSPIQVEKFMSDTAGSLGRYGINAADTVLNKLGIVPDDQIGGKSALSDFKRRTMEARGKEKEDHLKTAGQKYYENVDKATEGLPKHLKDSWQSYNTSNKNFLGEVLFDKNSQAKKQAKAAAYIEHPELFEVDKRIDKLGRKKGEPGNPLYDLTYQQALMVVQQKALPPGAKDEGLNQLYDQQWYQKFKNKEDKFYEKIFAGKKQKTDNPYPQRSKQLTEAMDYYYDLPSSYAKSAWKKANPQLAAQMDAYYEAKNAWTNAERAKLGLPPIEQNKYGKSGGGSGGSRGGSRGGRRGSKNKYANLDSLVPKRSSYSKGLQALVDEVQFKVSPRKQKVDKLA